MTDPISTPVGAGQGVDRRDFVRTAAVLGTLPLVTPVWGATRADDRLKVGLVGCGGRGTGAAANAMAADDGVVIWAMADVFPDRIERSITQLEENADETRVLVAPERRFVGFDAVDQLLATDVDVVILATPPGFRPLQLEKAVAAGKHVFTEKPMAVDVPGAKRAMAAAKAAKDKNLAMVSGFCWRYSRPEQAIYGRIVDGDLGDIYAGHSTYHSGPLGTQARKADWNDMEFQLKNWWHFNWLAGDIIVEQACHSVDKLNWAKNNETPVKCVSLGGRGNREGEERGDVFDHFTAIYEYADGSRNILTCRQQANCSNDNTDWVAGSKGLGFINGWAPTRTRLEYNDGDPEHVRGRAPAPVPGDPRRQPRQRRRLHDAEHPDVDHGPRRRLHRADPDLGRPHEVRAGARAEQPRVGPAA
ncbi:MAG: Gfo/Idh/MocA family protein [Planctomycetota bacterium]|jgi:predicted dehydrogenase